VRERERERESERERERFLGTIIYDRGKVSSETNQPQKS
jgi:hypothetical protein